MFGCGNRNKCLVTGIRMGVWLFSGERGFADYQGNKCLVICRGTSVC